MKIKFMLHSRYAVPELNKKGDWIDLCYGGIYKIQYKEGDSIMASLGISMKLPVGFTAYVAPRSSLFKKKGLILTNSIGIIDNSYCGNQDIWKASFYCLKFDGDGYLTPGEKICQFCIAPSMSASFWVKLRWMFVRKIKFYNVASLGNCSRGGFGSTGGYKN